MCACMQDGVAAYIAAICRCIIVYFAPSRIALGFRIPLPVFGNLGLRSVRTMKWCVRQEPRPREHRKGRGQSKVRIC